MAETPTEVSGRDGAGPRAGRAAHAFTLDQQVVATFRIFWDNFPFPALLLRRDHLILDSNAAARAAGIVPGGRCVDNGPIEAHRGCLAMRALKEKVGKRQVKYNKFIGRVMDTYWIPLVGHDDVYVHFASDISPYASEAISSVGTSSSDDACDGCAAVG